MTLLEKQSLETYVCALSKRNYSYLLLQRTLKTIVFPHLNANEGDTVLRESLNLGATDLCSANCKTQNYFSG